MQTPDKEKPADPADVFRDVLEDVVRIGRALATHCATVEEMVALCEHGVSNPAQCRLLMKEVGKAK